MLRAKNILLPWIFLHLLIVMVMTLRMSASLNGWLAAWCYPNCWVHWITHLLLWSLQNSIYVSYIIIYIIFALAGQIPIKVLSPPSSSLHRLQREDAETAPVLCTFCRNLQQHHNKANCCLAKTTASSSACEAHVNLPCVGNSKEPDHIWFPSVQAQPNRYET